MAILIPDKPFTTNSEGEIDLFDFFKDLLPDEYYVLHSLRWTGGQGKIDGEIDFVILHPDKGILLIEVKSGLIEYENRRLIQINRKTKEKKEIDPIGQLRSSKHRIIDLMGIVIGPKEFFPVGYMVWFPSLAIQGNLPPDFSEDFTADQRHLDNVKVMIDKAFAFWINHLAQKLQISRASFNSILQVLCGNFNIAPSLSARFDKESTQFVKLTNEQIRIIDYLEDQDKAVISGMAGTGKTLLALEKAKRIAQNKESVLFLCYNSNLAAYLEEFCQIPFVHFRTFHAFCKGELPAASIYDIEEIDKQYLERLLSNEYEFPFNHVIIDEAQDFKNEWIEILSLRVKKTFYVFYDPNQLIQRSSVPDWIKEAECRLSLSRCVRNTQEIAESLCSVIEYKNPKYWGEAVHGIKPMWHEFNTSKEIVSYIIKTIAEHRKVRNADLSDFAIITLGTESSTIFQDLKNNIKLPSSSNIRKGFISATTVRKFKGLEAKVAFIVDLNAEDFGNIEKRNLIYTSFSRACHELHIFSTLSSEECFIKALEPRYRDRKRVLNKTLFFKDFKIQKL